jgi:hypothetical protein
MVVLSWYGYFYMNTHEDISPVLRVEVKINMLDLWFKNRPPFLLLHMWTLKRMLLKWQSFIRIFSQIWQYSKYERKKTLITISYCRQLWQFFVRKLWQNFFFSKYFLHNGVNLSWKRFFFFFFSQPPRQSEEFDHSQRDGHPIYILLDGSLH